MPRSYLCTTTNPYYNLSLERLLSIQSRDISLMLWQNEPSVIIGRCQNVWAEADVPHCENNGIHIVRRDSGGGAVYHDLGNLNYSFFCPRHFYNADAFLRVVLDALDALGINAQAGGRNDILLNGKKISGTASALGTYCVLHGTMLVHVDFDAMRQCLTPSIEKLQSKGISSVKSRVMNLADTDPAITIEHVCNAIHAAFTKAYGDALLEKAPVPYGIEEIVATREDRAYVFNASPPFDSEVGTRFDWGNVTLQLSIKKGKVTETHVFSDSLDVGFIQSLPDLLTGKEYPFGLAAALRSGAGTAIGGQKSLDIATWLEQRFSME